MADDLDDLLDEYEGKFFKEDSREKHLSTRGETSSSQHGGIMEGLDQIMSEICPPGEDFPIHRSQTKSTDRIDGNNIPEQLKLQHHTNANRCYPLLLGGSKVAMGFSCPTAHRACDRLHCTACNFHVIFFQEHIWDSRSDYLFFRNHVPDYERLKKNLVKKKGYRAYACQCQWESVCESLDIATCSKLKSWICSKHHAKSLA